MHYIKVLYDYENEDSNLELVMDMFNQTKTPKAKASLGSMISSLNGAKKYHTLKVIGQVDG